MSPDLQVIAGNWQMILFHVFAYMIVKALAIYGVALAFRATHRDGIDRAVFMAQGGEFEPEIASFGAPLLTVALGMDDLVATFGGSIHDNTTKVYRSAYLSEDENAQLNRGIERIAADPAALAYADRWHRASGRSPVKLVAVHNAIDSLVPFANETALAQRMKDAGNDGNLLLITVPSTYTDVPATDIKGLTHCGFSPEQHALAWSSLTTWVNTGVRPALPATQE